MLINDSALGTPTDLKEKMYSLKKNWWESSLSNHSSRPASAAASISQIMLAAARDNPHSLLKVFSNDSETPCWAHMIIYFILWYHPHLLSFLTTSLLFKLMCYTFYETLSSGVGAAQEASPIALILQLKFCTDICVGLYVYRLTCKYKCSQASVYMYMHICVYTHPHTPPHVPSRFSEKLPGASYHRASKHEIIHALCTFKNLKNQK